MKGIAQLPAALASHYALSATTVAYGLKVVRKHRISGSTLETLGFTTHDKPKTISGVVYKSNPGLSVSSIQASSGTAVGNLELETLFDDQVFKRVAILNGLWRNAEYTLFRFNWQSVSDGLEVITAGTLGEMKMQGPKLVVELRDWRQYLQQPVGSLSTRTCRYRLGSTSYLTGGFCTKDISSAPFMVTGTVTSAGQQIFTDTGRTEVDDYFGEGELEWLTGNNAEAFVKIKQFTADIFTLAAPMYGLVQVGDTYRAYVGCRKRYEEDCITKFNNGVNFGGEPHRRGINVLTAAPGESQT